MNSNWNQLKRHHRRYTVNWQAFLEIDSPDFNVFFLTPVLDLSRSGALVRSPSLCFHNYHLAVAAQNNELNLIIRSPLSELDSKIHLRRYVWDEQSKGYHLGVEFRDICDKNQDLMGEIIRSLLHHTPKDSMCDEKVYE